MLLAYPVLEAVCVMSRYVLGIDTSFDDTALSLYDPVDHLVVDSVLSSQTHQHVSWQGVVPHWASYYHLRTIDKLYNQLLYVNNITLQDIGLICCTSHPGLASCLVIGLTFARTLSILHNIPLQEVNHIHGHLISPLLEHSNIYPNITLSIAGGHSDFYLVDSPVTYHLIGQCLDDACGECFDKTARILGLGMYGKYVEQSASQYSPVNAKSLVMPRVKTKNLDLSFSGLKTAFSRFWSINKDSISQEHAAFLMQASITKHLTDKVKVAFRRYRSIKNLCLVGGVACNKYVRQTIGALCKKSGIRFIVPSNRYCVDNASMICLAGYSSKTSG